MAKFSKYNNPKRKKARRRLNTSDLIEREAYSAYLDRKNGYNLPLEHYQQNIDNEINRRNESGNRK